MHLALALVLSFGGPPQDRWFGRDKFKHFAAAALIQSAGYMAFHRRDVARGTALWRASAVTATISLGKEVVDRQHGRQFSVRDLAWDVAGAGTATLAIIQATRK